MKRDVYMDYAATTFVKPEVLEKMLPYFHDFYGNANSLHARGREARKAIDTARSQVAAALGAQPNEIFFTSCGTEADNWALRGVAQEAKEKGRGNHIITSSIEHPAVLNTCKALEKEGFEVTYLPVDQYGTISLDELEKAIKKETVLISIMFANNEIGTIQPVKEIGAIAKAHKIPFHTDAVQAVGSRHIDVNELNIDLLSLSGHKFYGPKGVGALYIRKGTRIKNLMYGGEQERGRRPGTENTPLIVGLGEAITLAVQNMNEESARLTKLRDRLKAGILEKIPYSRLNGHPGNRLCNNLNFSFDFIEGESMLLMLDAKGISGSSGSACSSGSLDPSHVLLAIGLPHETAHGSLRLTIGAGTTEEDVDYVLAELPPIVQRLRDMSPLYNEREDLKYV